MEIPKEGIRLHRLNFNAIGQQLQPLLESGDCYRLILKPWKDKRSLNQNSLSHMWYGEISDWLIRRGKDFASPEWVEDAMKHTYLGYVEREMVDVVTGQTTVLRSLRHTSDLDTGDMHFYLTQVEGWALSIGCKLTVPANSEYLKLKEKQNG